MNALTKLNVTIPAIPHADCPSCRASGVILSGWDGDPDSRECADCINGTCHGDLAEAVKLREMAERFQDALIAARAMRVNPAFTQEIEAAIDSLDAIISDNLDSGVIYLLRRETRDDA